MKSSQWTRFFLTALWLCLWCGTISLSAAPPSGENVAFIEGVRQYEAKAYPAAMASFEKVLAAGVRNGKLFYNMGNACLKTGDIGPAILWYERALALIPNDPDLQFNLSYARSLVKDEKEGESSPVVAVLFFWKDMFRIAMLQWAGIIINAALWLFFGLYRFFRKGVLLHFCYGMLILSVLVLGTTGWRLYEDAFHPQAIILPHSVAVRSGQASESTELFILHAGTKVAVKKQANGFLKIRFSEDKIGWIPESVAGII
jgi:tetratricopeptide (TPR) repeat protein